MLIQRHRQYGFVTALALVVSLGFVGTATALQSSSTNYTVNESQFGAGSSTNDCSTSYCAKTSVGDTASGRANSTSYGAEFGGNTTDEPLLEIIVEGGNQDLGVLDSTTTGTASMVVKIRNYLSNGYSLQISGGAPSQGTHTLAAMTTQSTSHQGAEQFGINLAKNTSPDIGAEPVQVPSDTFAFGQVADGYSDPDLFMYNSNDIVASSTRSSGQTVYTLSMILNVSNTTPGGRYQSNFSAVVAASF